MGFCVIHHVRPPLWLKTDWLVALTQAESSAHQRRQLAHDRPGNCRSCISAASMESHRIPQDSWPHQRRSAASTEPDTQYDIMAASAIPVGGQTSWSCAQPEPEPEFPEAADREASHQPSRQETRAFPPRIPRQPGSAPEVETRALPLRIPRQAGSAPGVGMAALLPVQNENAKNWLQSGGSVEIPSGCIEGGWDIYMPFRRQRRLNVGDMVFCALRLCGGDRRFCASRITRIDWNLWKGRTARWFTIADGWCYERDIYGILRPEGH